MIPEVEEDDFATRRARLSAQIAKQRSELAEAYSRLEKPIRYTEYGLRGIGFIRANPWIFAAAPTVVSLVMSFLGGKKKSPPPTLNPRPTHEQKSKGLKGAVVTGAQGIWSLVKLYRRVRPYFP